MSSVTSSSLKTPFIPSSNPIPPSKNVVQETLEKHKHTLTAVGAVGLGVGITALGAGFYTLHHARGSIASLQKLIAVDLNTLEKHYAHLEKGEFLDIHYRNLPESFKSLRAVELNFNRPFKDANGKIAPKQVTEYTKEWVPFILHLFNGFPQKTRHQFVGYLLSPSFWFKDLFSKDAMWLKKMISIAGTPAKKMVQFIGTELKGVFSEAELKADMQNFKRESNRLLREAFSLHPKHMAQSPAKRFEKLTQGITLRFLSKMALPLFKGIIDLQDNAPPQPLKLVVGQLLPYFKKTYPQLDTRLSKFKIINVASVGHILTHEDLPGSVFKVIRPIEDNNLLASARALYAILTALPEPLLQAYLKKSGNDSLVTSLQKATKTQEYSTIAYQIALNYVKNIKDETNVQSEVEMAKAFYNHYHQPLKAGEHQLGLVIPKIFGYDAQNKVIEMQRIQNATSMSKLDAKDPIAGNVAKAKALYGYLNRMYHLSDTHLFHPDMHGGQVLEMPDGNMAILDFAGGIRLTPEARKKGANTLLVAHLNADYYDKKGTPPGKWNVAKQASALGIGIDQLLPNRDLSSSRHYTNLTTPLWSSGVGVLKGLEGDNVSSLGILLNLGKLNRFTEELKRKSVLEKIAQLNPAERQERLVFLSRQDFEADVHGMVDALLATSDLRFSGGEADRIRSSFKRRLLEVFHPYVEAPQKRGWFN